MNSSASGDRRPYTFDRVVRILFSISAVAFAIWLTDYLKMVLLPFVVAWLVAYMLEPFVQYNRALLRTRKRFIPVAMTLLEAAMMLLLLGVLFLPGIFAEFHRVGVVIEQYASRGANVPMLPESIHNFLRKVIDFNYIADFMQEQDMERLMSIIPSFVSGGIEIVMWVINWFFTLIYLVFIMLDYDNLIRGFKRMVPYKFRHRTFSVIRDVKASMNHYFRGQALVALCVGIMFSIGLSVVGLPLAIVTGMFIGLLNMVPYLQFISIIPVSLLCLVSSTGSGDSFWPMWWSCILVYAVIQCIQDLILTPKIMGKIMGLNPAVILFSLSLWGTLLGFIGLIVALPLTTLLLSYY
ncbi:MAG: AI-2E family transporter, partial [Muribaculaceae bacterium]|nr:AI-2E family transporter [Muribaculaceae bacterium]